MKKKIVFMLMAVSFGCTAKKFAVENADILINYQINKRLPLYSRQKEELNRDVEHFLKQKKALFQEILPLMDEIDLKSNEKIESQYKKLEIFFMQISRDFTKYISKFLAQLDSNQQKDLFAVLDEENREMQKKERTEIIEDLEDRIQKFIGPINQRQKKIINENADYFHDRAKRRIAHRKNLHQKFRSIYLQESTQAVKAGLFQEAFTQYQEESIKDNRNLEIIRKLQPSISDDQHERFRREVLEIKELIRHYHSVEY
jgi:hypothetical protein